MDENDPRRYDDPRWYDRAEIDVSPGLILNSAAYLFLLLAAGVVTVARVYWLPDRLWCWAADCIERRRTAGHKPF